MKISETMYHGFYCIPASRVIKLGFWFFFFSVSLLSSSNSNLQYLLLFAFWNMPCNSSIHIRGLPSAASPPPLLWYCALAWMQGWQGLPLPPLTLLDLQFHEAVSHLPGVGLAVTFPPELHGVTAVIPTVLQRQVHHHDVEGAVVVRDKLHTVVAALPPEGRFLGAVARQFVVPAEVVVQLLLGDVADVPLVGAALVPRAAEVPGFVEQVVPLGQGAADAAGQGDVLALGADAERVRGGDQESCCPSCRGEGTESEPGFTLSL